MQDMFDLDQIMEWIDDYAGAEIADALPYGPGSGRTGYDS